MRGGLSAIQQTLTPEASSILSHSIAEAARRSHGQTTPLHVAATLLSSPTGLLRQACVRSHPNSSHPLQCRALELCFSVALDRLPTTTSATPEPPLSNALVAALKRAQAHQRRGCPEQQQQPLLAVKVELEQLIISILDDPSVSRVMKEASFSSPAVKAAIEHSLSLSSKPSPMMGVRAGPGMGGGRSLYLNPKLQQHQHQHQQGSSNNAGPGLGREEDVKKVMDILTRPGRKNPVLVGEAEPQEVAKEALRKIREGVLKDVEVLGLEREFGGVDKVLGKVKELEGLIERKLLESVSLSGVVVDLGDLKWLVDQPSSLGVSERATQAVAEIGRVLRKFGQGRRVWLIGTATCETYLRCQVYHPNMETDWDLQVVSIVAKAKPALPGVLPRLGSSGGILSSSVECLTPMKGFQIGAPPLIRRVSENVDPRTKPSCCPQCTDKCNEEIANLTVQGQPEKSSSEVKTDTTPPKPLPFWLQNAKLSNNDPAQNKDQDLILRRQKEELQKKWNNTCSQLHPNFHGGASSERIVPSPLSVTGLYMNPNLLRGRELPQPKLLQQPKILGEALKLNISPPQAHQSNPSPPRSPVRTDLLLGPSKPTENLNRAPIVGGDTDSFKKLLKGLMEKVSWQKEAASAIASTISRCKSGGGRSRSGASKGDVWLLFVGPDRIGKNKMASALSELVCGAGPVVISLGSRREGDELDLNFRGKTAIDRIAEAVRRNPFSVIVLRDIDEADVLVRGTIKRAMERGRLVDSHGREISLGNIIFVVTVNSVPGQQGVAVSEEKMVAIANGGWQLRILVGGENENPRRKRAPGWLHHDEDDDQIRASKMQRKFDLNQMADVEDDRLDGSHNSSDLTMEHGEEHAPQNRGLLPPSPPAVLSAVQELLGCVDEAVVFRAVDLAPIRVNVERAITGKFSAALGDRLCLKIDVEALEKIASGVWLGQADVESWVEKALVPGFHQLKTTLAPRGPPMIARLELDHESRSRDQGNWLPGSVSVVANLQ